MRNYKRVIEWKWQVINLRGHFEVVRKEDSESIKEFTEWLLNMITHTRLLAEELSDLCVEENLNQSSLNKNSPL